MKQQEKEAMQEEKQDEQGQRTKQAVAVQCPCVRHCTDTLKKAKRICHHAFEPLSHIDLHETYIISA